MDIKTAIRQLTQRQDLQTEDMTALMRGIMTGQMTDAQIAAFLVALQLKGICAAELLGAVTVMRELVTRVDVADKLHLVDTCGTGGSGTDTFYRKAIASILIGYRIQISSPLCSLFPL